MTPQSVHRYETGERDPPSQKLARLAHALGTTVADLMQPGEPQPPAVPAPQPTRDGKPEDREARAQRSALEFAMVLIDCAPRPLSAQERVEMIQYVLRCAAEALRLVSQDQNKA